MKYFVLVFFFLINSYLLSAQTTIKGTVTDKKKVAIVGCNVYIKNSYDGATTNDNGYFEFTTFNTTTDTLLATLIGFETYVKIINYESKLIELNISLKESVTELNAVVISAGAFEASDEKKSVTLRPLDIVTTAGAGGDIDGALKTLPGAQQIGEQEGLFVRGGDASETRTIVDGMIVSNPYFSSVPSVPQRGRFTPFLFKGTTFSTGGYSAQYGQALSSVLLLESQDMPTQSFGSVGLTILGGAAGYLHAAKNQKSALGFNVSYFNLLPYMKIIKQQREWIAPPENLGASIFGRWKPTKTGLIKLYVDYGYSDLSVKFPNIDDTTGLYPSVFKLNNNNLYSNLSYKDILSKNWSFSLGLSHR